MYYTQTINGAKAHVFDTKDLNKCEVVLSSSASVRTLSTLAYDDIPKGCREVARVNAALFQADTSNPSVPYGTHLGWEYSDMQKTSCLSDSSADVIQFKDGSILMGDINEKDVDLEKIKWAYTGSHVILKDGQDVTILANWRTKYPQGKYCWSWFASRDDGTYVIGAIDSAATCDTNSIRTYLKGLGCTNAIINDGGGSAELIVGGVVKNRAKSTERAIANGLFIYESTTKEVQQSSKEDEYKKALEQIKAIADKVLL